MDSDAVRTCAHALRPTFDYPTGASQLEQPSAVLQTALGGDLVGRYPLAAPALKQAQQFLTLRRAHDGLPHGGGSVRTPIRASAEIAASTRGWDFLGLLALLRRRALRVSNLSLDDEHGSVLS